MVRTQIQLSEQQAVRLRRLAAERRVSVAALIREAVDAAFPGSGLDDRHARALSVAGKFWSGPVEIAAEHDRELEHLHAE